MKKHLSTLLKIGITLVGLYFAFRQVQFRDLLNQWQDVQWGWMLFSFVLINAGLAIRAYRWLLLLRGLGATVSLKRLVELYFVGNFFNTFLPSGFGGDVIRVSEVAQDVPNNIAAGTVIVDRLTGLLMLFVMTLVALPFRPDNFPTELVWPITAVALVGLLGGFVLLEGSLIRRFGGWLPGKLSVTNPDMPLARLLQAVQGSGRRAVFGALAVSTVFNLMLTGWWYTIGLSLGYTTVSYTYYLLVIPILSVATLVPSIGGLGVRESLAPVLFAGAGLLHSEAIGLSLTVFILLRLAGLVGAPIYIMTTIRNGRRQPTN